MNILCFPTYGIMCKEFVEYFIIQPELNSSKKLALQERTHKWQQLQHVYMDFNRSTYFRLFIQIFIHVTIFLFEHYWQKMQESTAFVIICDDQCKIAVCGNWCVLTNFYIQIISWQYQWCIYFLLSTLLSIIQTRNKRLE